MGHQECAARRAQSADGREDRGSLGIAEVEQNALSYPDRRFRSIEAGLKEHGYEGLVNKAFDCGCGFPDFAPCGAIYPQCEPAILYIVEGGVHYFDTPETGIAPNEKIAIIEYLKSIVLKIDNGYTLGRADAAIIETAIFRLQAWEAKDKERKLKEQA